MVSLEKRPDGRTAPLRTLEKGDSPPATFTTPQLVQAGSGASAPEQKGRRFRIDDSPSIHLTTPQLVAALLERPA